MLQFIKYLFQKPVSIKSIICRWNGHPAGVIWYNPEGLTPDMHCRNCGDDLS